MAPPTKTIEIVGLVVVFMVAWYLFQVGSRKKGQLWFKTKKILTCLFVYGAAVLVLLKQRVPGFEAVMLTGFAGLGASWLLVRRPNRDRRIPKATRREVIERDLTSKGLEWDPGKYHIDHVVPFSRGGDHSARNLRVIERKQNLRKGARMPRLRDFIKRA